MNINAAIVVDDLAADRQLTVHVLKRAGWTVWSARNSVEGQALINEHGAAYADQLIIITDLHMPKDPAQRSLAQRGSAGACFALNLRTAMEHGEIARVPIIALTALSEHEVHQTALAFGCDIVLTKPATPDLPQRIAQALSQAATKDAVGVGPLLHLLRHHLVQHLQETATLQESDLTKALLAYRRYGMVGLGQSELAAQLVPRELNPLQRGEQVHALLLKQIDAVLRLGLNESLAILRAELLYAITPEAQAQQLAISLSEYYRRRREAIQVVFKIVRSKEFDLG